MQFVRDAYHEDRSIEWRRIHKLPDYVRNFPHHVHIKAGVSCYSCHGQILGMPVVFQSQPLSMGWCLACHADPEPHLVPPEKVTQLVWVEQEMNTRRRGGSTVDTATLLEAIHRAPPDECGACHH